MRSVSEINDEIMKLYAAKNRSRNNSDKLDIDLKIEKLKDELNLAKLNKNKPTPAPVPEKKEEVKLEDPIVETKETTIEQEEDSRGTVVVDTIQNSNNYNHNKKDYKNNKNK